MNEQQKIDKCPWKTSPATVEEMLLSCDAQTLWELQNKKAAPYSWCITPTRQFMSNLCDRLLKIEKDPT